MGRIIEIGRIGKAEAQDRLDAQKVIKKESTPIINATMQQMRMHMRRLGFFDTGVTDASFRKGFIMRDGYLEGVSIRATRNAFVLAHVGRDYRWQTVGGRYNIIKQGDPEDFIFVHMDEASEKIGTLVADINADLVVKRIFPTK